MEQKKVEKFKRPEGFVASLFSWHGPGWFKCSKTFKKIPSHNGSDQTKSCAYKDASVQEFPSHNGSDQT